MKHIIHNKYDVIVIGAGPAGVPAALAASRLGCKVLLVERNAFLGGTGVSGLSYLGFLDHKGRKTLGGIPAEIILRLQDLNGTQGHHYSPVHNSITDLNPEIVKLVMAGMCREAGVEILLNCETVDVNVDNGILMDVIAYSKCTYFILSASVFIDATGDGDVAYKAGVPYILGQQGSGQAHPAALLFTVGGVDMNRFFSYLAENPGEIGTPDCHDQKYSLEFLKNTPGHCFIGLSGLIEKAKRDGKYRIPGDFFVYITTPVSGQLAINSTRISNIDATDPLELTRASLEGHKQIMDLMGFMKEYIPGFERCVLCHISPTLGIRETRHFRCQVQVDKAMALGEVINDETIALAAYNINAHCGNDTIKTPLKPFGIPLNSLKPQNIKRLLLAGRDIDTDITAFGSMCTMGTCMAIGQAAGVCAALAARQDKYPDEISAEAVRRQLLADGAYLASDA
jgi:hypothetical protein